MPGYVKKALKKFNHKPRKHPDRGYIPKVFTFKNPYPLNPVHISSQDRKKTYLPQNNFHTLC